MVHGRTPSNCWQVYRTEAGEGAVGFRAPRITKSPFWVDSSRSGDLSGNDCNIYVYHINIYGVYIVSPGSRGWESPWRAGHRHAANSLDGSW